MIKRNFEIKSLPTAFDVDWCIEIKKNADSTDLTEKNADAFNT